MLFITNREPKGSIRFKKNRAWKFDLNKNAPSNSVYFLQRNKKDDYTEIGKHEFMEQLRNSEYRELLFYIHGFNNLPERDIFHRTEILQEYFDQKSPKLIKVIPLIWPCDDDFGIVKDYFDDQDAAELSNVAFSRLMHLFMEWQSLRTPETQCMKRMNVLAHSMGNRVLKETLIRWNAKMPKGLPMLFRNTFLVAADIVNESLERNNRGVLISHVSKNVSVYHAADDLALNSSKIVNLGHGIASRRLGHTGPENLNLIPANVYTIDCNRVNTDYDNPMGHSYFVDFEHKQPGLVFDHILHSIKTGHVKVNDIVTRTSRI